MKDGRPVRTTRSPLTKPMPRLNRRATPIAGHSGQSACRVRSMMLIPAAPMMDPTDRSNSPAIMSSATATASIPSGAAALSTAAVPSAPRKAGPAATAKSSQTSTAPIAAPSSGRERDPFSGRLSPSAQ